MRWYLLMLSFPVFFRDLDLVMTSGKCVLKFRFDFFVFTPRDLAFKVKFYFV